MAYLVQQTEIFVKWHANLRDLRARAAITRRLDRVAAGSLGDVKSVGGNVSELRVDVGPGYRLYFTMRNRVVVVLLVGGDKRTQAADIKRAHELASEV
ncbi:MULTISPECIES: type II toxin-antitoxin system RelE/ParE family toxin [unclassified Bradyrhizobium]|uniref:type II toxin-antitoxin system RelE/ParE family toxin n=1 Tax=unclassified Bradyrhizobium TaxID=2631580 RepID=UPI0028E2FA16|nr:MULTISPECIES: type II toxin-antitoxin system RelE/ParE family toxin [unclassified Bradyrhizobium]